VALKGPNLKAQPHRQDTIQTQNKATVPSARNLQPKCTGKLTPDLVVFEPPDSRDPRARTGLCQSAVGLCG